MLHASKRLEIILKVSEACNIACTYCYYFFSGDDRPANRPARITSSTVDGLIEFLNGAYSAGFVDHAQIDFHGGEPLLLGPKNFRDLCRRLEDELTVPHTFCITTNAMLVDDNWIDTFSRYNVGICVSVDGPQHVHDKQRIDHKGRGTYDRVILGLRRLQEAASNGVINEPAALCVVDPLADGSEVYVHIVHELGIRVLDFLMPDVTHDAPLVFPAEVAQFMSAAFASWLKDDDPGINVRIFKSTLHLLVSGQTFLAGYGGSLPFAVTVGSNGQLDSDDFLKPCGADVISTPLYIQTASLQAVMLEENLQNLARALQALPRDCSDCPFRGVCKGGQATHRYKRASGFDNRSVYCETHYSMFQAAASHLLRTGVSAQQIIDRCIPAQL